tara:strand:+ start:186 stop:1709 length:1524 start_codon:yes stop_codon:yes gene_type:complete
MHTSLFTSKSSYELDKLCIARGIKFIDLMENAGKSAFVKIEKEIIPSLKKFNSNILILCGPGNNGGDGLVIAKYLKSKGYNIDISFPVSDSKKINNNLKSNLNKLNIEDKKFKDIKFNKYSLIVDSIFGVGLNRKFSKKIINVIKKINKTSSCIVSIDIASGINADTGELMPVSIEADHTITFVAPKVGNYLLPGKNNSGEIHTVSIGEKISDVLKVSKFSKLKLNTPDFWVKKFKWPSMSHHKYNRGHILVKSGPKISTGASRLAAVSALRAGAGAVTLASDSDSLLVNASHLTSVMLKEINNADDFFNFVKEKKINTLIIGPGSGINQITKELVIRAIKSEISFVLDADGLTLFQKNPNELFELLNKRRKRENIILTPHEGEFNRLFDFGKISKIDKANRAANITKSTILFKGNDTVISSPKKISLLTKESSSFLATAGSGDVLSGICGSFLGQGMKSHYAAAAASWIHNEIGLDAGPGLIAEDMNKFISKIMSKKLKRIYENGN